MEELKSQLKDKLKELTGNPEKYKALVSQFIVQVQNLFIEGNAENDGEKCISVSTQRSS